MKNRNQSSSCCSFQVSLCLQHECCSDWCLGSSNSPLVSFGCFSQPRVSPLHSFPSFLCHSVLLNVSICGTDKPLLCLLITFSYRSRHLEVWSEIKWVLSERRVEFLVVFLCIWCSFDYSIWSICVMLKQKSLKSFWNDWYFNKRFWHRFKRKCLGIHSLNTKDLNVSDSWTEISAGES